MPLPGSNLVTEGDGSMLALAGVINTGDIKNNGIDTAFIRYEESRGKPGASSHAKQQESNSSSQVRARPRGAKLPKHIEQSMNVKSGGLNLNLQDVRPHAKDDMSSRVGPEHRGALNLKAGQTRLPVGTSREQSHRGGPLTSKTSKLMSKIISESMLDCRDIGIGTGALNGEEIDQVLKSSQDISRAAGADANAPPRNRDRLGNEYRPIQQVNVQLLNQHEGYHADGRSRKSGAASRNKSSVHEKISILRSELGGESTIPPSESPNAVMTNRKIRTMGNEARQSPRSQARGSGGVSRDSMTGLRDMQAMLVG